MCTLKSGRAGGSDNRIAIIGSVVASRYGGYLVRVPQWPISFRGAHIGSDQTVQIRGIMIRPTEKYNRFALHRKT